jgi:DNA-binding NtrC family response regulator
MYSILIIDDEHAVRQSFADFFEDRLWQVIQADSAETALTLVAETKPTVAIVDVRLPGMNGTDFIRQLIKLNIQFPCILCTGSPEFSFPSDFSELSFVSKMPFKKPVADLFKLETLLLEMIESTLDSQE